MQCGFPLKYHKSQLKIFTSNWLKDGQVLKSHNSDRIEEKTEIEDLEHFSLVQSSLIIKFLKPEDFGLYKCIYDYTAVISSRGSR